MIPSCFARCVEIFLIGQCIVHLTATSSVAPPQTSTDANSENTLSTVSASTDASTSGSVPEASTTIAPVSSAVSGAPGNSSTAAPNGSGQSSNASVVPTSSGTGLNTTGDESSSTSAVGTTVSSADTTFDNPSNTQHHLTDTELGVILAVSGAMFVLFVFVVAVHLCVIMNKRRAQWSRKRRMRSKRRRRRAPSYSSDEDTINPDEIYVPFHGPPMYSDMGVIAPAAEPYNMLPVITTIPEVIAPRQRGKYSPYLYDNNNRMRDAQTRMLTTGGHVHDNFRPYRSRYRLDDSSQPRTSVWYTSVPQLGYSRLRAKI